MATDQDKTRNALLADREWLAAEYGAKGARDIAADLGCSHHRVYAALPAAGIPVRWNGIHVGRNKSMVPPEWTDQVVARYAAGSTAEEIAGELGLQVRAVTRLLEERGVKRSRSEAAGLAHGKKSGPQPNRREWPAEAGAGNFVAAEVLGRYGRGESGMKIARELDLAPSTVYRLLEKAGTLRTHAEASLLRARAPHDE